MRVKKITLGILLMMACAGFAHAQNFANRQLEYLRQLMNCPVPDHSAHFKCPQVSAQLPLTVEYNELGQISHLGVALFTPELKSKSGKPVCDFKERLFLELFLQKTDAEIQKLLDEYKITLDVSLRNNSLRRSIEYALEYILVNATESSLLKDSLMWTCYYKNNRESVSLIFPANYDLILGLDKKEAEENLTRQLRRFRCEKPALVPMSMDMENLKPVTNRIFVLPGAPMFITSMNSNLYFMKNETQTYHLVFDRNFPEESVSNLFMYPDKKSEGITMQVLQRVYGSQTNQYEVTLYDFLCFWRDDYETFVGMEKYTEQEIAFTVIFKSRYFNCAHLLYVQAKPEDFFEKKNALKTTFYTYIPNQNILNLYKNVVERKKFNIN